MGCDIHAYVEVKVDGEWLQYSALCMARHYALFGRIAGVRDKDQTPIVKPRGLPKDLSKLVQLAADDWNGDAHTHGWLTDEEAEQINFEYGNEYLHPPVFGYLFGNDLRTRDIPGIEDCRVVFWFDN